MEPKRAECLRGNRVRYIAVGLGGMQQRESYLRINSHWKGKTFHCRFHGETYADNFNTGQGWIVKSSDSIKQSPVVNIFELKSLKMNLTTPNHQTSLDMLPPSFSGWSRHSGILEQHSNEQGTVQWQRKRYRLRADQKRRKGTNWSQTILRLFTMARLTHNCQRPYCGGSHKLTVIQYKYNFPTNYYTKIWAREKQDLCNSA